MTHAEPLAGRTVLLTRPGGTSDHLPRSLRAAGARVLQLAAMDIQPLEINAPALEILQQVDAFDMLIFVSRNAVHYACELMADAIDDLKTRKVLAIGRGTRAALQRRGFKQVIIARDNAANSKGGSEALLEIDELQRENVRQRRIMILRGAGGRDLLGDTLASRGAEVRYVELYRRVKPQPGPDIIENIWLVEKPDAVVLTSVEGLENLLELTAAEHRPVFLQTPLVVISRRVKNRAESLGFSAGIRVASGYSEGDFMDALRRLLEAHNDE